MSDTVLKVENLSKQYRLGDVGTGTLSHDLNRWWHKVRGKEDPYLKVGEANDRTKKGGSDYVWALQDINFEVKQGEILGIIGKNGAGKSTLLKILSKVTAPTTGSIKAKGRIASLLEVGTGFHPELTGRENIFLNGAILGMTKAEIKAKLDEIVDFAGVEKYLDTPVKRYSSGMTVRLGFAVAAHLEPEILIVDEVLAVGDAEFQKKAIGKMQDVSKGEGRTVLFVSHNMGSIKKLCDNALILDKGKVSYGGDCKDAILEYLRLNSRSEDHSNLISNLLNYKREQGLGEFFKLSKCSLLNSERSQVKKLAYGEPFSIEYEFLSKKNNHDLYFVVGFSTPIGERIASGVVLINTGFSDKVRGRFDIKDLTLFPGQYTMHLGIRRYDQITDAFRFEVMNKTHGSIVPYQGVDGYVNLQLGVSDYKKDNVNA
jgi:lipopolysaccharide transport system ATP-binding protein